MQHRPVVLCILDGWGHRLETQDNAIAIAKTPHWDWLCNNYPLTFLEASGLDVGLPEGQMGNSEVGHMCIGSGRVIMQDLPRIHRAIQENSIPLLPIYQQFVHTLKQAGGTCHLMGLLSSGGVHSHDHHMLALAHLLNQERVPTFIHAFLDGRDTAPTSGYTYLEALLHNLEQHPSIRLATVSGRFFAMDRDQRWERTQKAYEAIVQAKAPLVNDILQHVTQSYEQGITDEFIPPSRLAGFSGMRDGDGLFMINFRADRVRQLLRALLLPQFNDFARSRVIRFSAQLGMTEYADDLSAVLPALFPSVAITKSLGEIVSDAGLRQLRLAETEKYAHVTFFFNGGRETPFVGEERCLVPSPRVQTYDLQPEMAAFAITDQLLNALSSQRYDFIVVNYANADMVGHTGHLTAAIRAVEVLDTCLGQLIDALQKQGGLLVVTADHGNIEMLVDPHSQQMHTAHTLNLVPFVIYTPTAKAFTLAKSGTLADIAPTLLELMGLPLPTEMTGRSLLRP